VKRFIVFYPATHIPLNRKIIWWLCQGMAFPLCRITALVDSFHSQLAATGTEGYPDESASMIRGSGVLGNIHI
jgi:hypothetical protein